MATRPSPWITAIAAVVFDKDHGARVCACATAGGAALSEAEQQALAFHALPDSMSFELRSANSVRDSSYFFRIPRDRPEGSSQQQQQQQHTGQGSEQVESGQQRWLYCYVFCRQRRDPRLPRGGEQVSVVVASEAPFNCALTPLAQAAGPLYLSQGAPALQAVVLQVACWPPPVPGATMQLPLPAAGATLSAAVPTFTALPPPQPRVDPAAALALTRRPSLRVRGSGSSGGGLTTRPSGVSVASSADVEPLASAASLDSTGGDAREASGSGDRSAHGPCTPRSPLAGLGQPAAAAARGGRVQQLVSSGSGQLGRRSVSWPAMGPGGDESVHGTFAEVDLPRVLQRCLRHAWTLWERSLAGDPLLVVAPTPAEAADAVAAVVSLIAPVPFAADFRPYLCIHDPAFDALVLEQRRRQQQQQQQQHHHHHHAGKCGEEGTASAAGAGSKAGAARPAPTLVGVTNTHFLTSLPGFPNVLAVGDKEGAPPPPSATSLLYPPNALRALRRRQQGAAALVGAHTQDLWSAVKPLTRPDAALLPPPGAAAGPGTVRALRRHFSRLTAALLAPFAPYFEPGPDGTVPRWDPAAFLSSLQLPAANAASAAAASAPPGDGGAAAPPAMIDSLLSDRVPGGLASIRALYARFITGPHFGPWFESRRAPVAHLVAEGTRPIAAAAATAVASADAVEGVAGIEAFIELEQRLEAAVRRRDAARQQQQDEAGSGHDQGFTTKPNGASSSGRAVGSSSDAGSGSGSGTASRGAGRREGDEEDEEVRGLELRLMSAFWSLGCDDLRQTLVSAGHRREALQRIARGGAPERAAALDQLVASLGQRGDSG